MIRHLAICLALVAAPAQAETVTLTFSDFGNLFSGAQDGFTYDRPTDQDYPAVIVERGPATIQAAPGDSFDLTGLFVEYSFPEVLGIRDTDLPAGVDPATPDGYDRVWRDNLWQLVDYPNLQITGLRAGAVVASARYFLPDSGFIGGYPISDVVDLVGVFTGLDTLIFDNAPGLTAAQDFGYVRDGDWHYTCLDSCGFVVIDNVVLDVTRAVTPPPGPSPVPLPVPGLLLLAALGGLGLSGMGRAGGRV